MKQPTRATVAGLMHAECMTTMELGAPLVSPKRSQVNKLAMFAVWHDEASLDQFLETPGLGHAFGGGWHVRMAFMRRWGRVAEFDDLPVSVGEQDPAAPVAALTLARLKLPQAPRFAKWGKPVETLVRDHPATTLALAAVRPLRTAATFSVWRTLADMQGMVQGQSDMPRSDRHLIADAERRRKDFHHEFTTLRFRPLSEHGEWNDRSGYVPTS